MNAQDVFNVAMALPDEELITLYQMLKKKLHSQPKRKKPKPPYMNFTMEDAFEYLIENHFNKPRKPDSK